jgi:hypothetical protein
VGRRRDVFVGEHGGWLLARCNRLGLRLWGSLFAGLDERWISRPLLLLLLPRLRSEAWRYSSDQDYKDAKKKKRTFTR